MSPRRSEAFAPRQDRRLRPVPAGPEDVFATFSDKDFLLGLNAGQTTGGAVAELVGLTIKK